MSPPALSVIVVNWNGGDEVVRNVGELRNLAARRRDLEVIVVDNGSEDGSVERLAADPGAVVHRLGRNAGFGPACNAGVGLSSAPLVLFLNPDAAPAAGADPVAPLLEAAAARPEIAGFAPILENAPGERHREAQERFQFRRLPTLGSIARELLLVERLRSGSPASLRARYLDVDRARSFEVEQAAGAALALRRSAFEAVSGFDPALVPAWWEDVDLCARLLARGHRIVTVPGSRFLHRGGSSIAEDRGRLSEAQYRRVFGRNLLRYARKHWGATALPVVRVLLLAGGLLRLAGSLLRPGPARSRRARAGAALGTVASAFSRIGAPE